MIPFILNQLYAGADWGGAVQGPADGFCCASSSSGGH